MSTREVNDLHERSGGGGGEGVHFFYMATAAKG